jgi:DNA-binding NtrC family response regulator
MRDLLERLVGEMVDKGIRYDDAQREFEKRFIARVLQSHDGNLGATAKTLGVHRNTLTRKLHDLKIKARPPAG